MNETLDHYPDHLVNSKTVLKQLINMKSLGINYVNSPFNNFSIDKELLESRPEGELSAADIWGSNIDNVYKYLHQRF